MHGARERARIGRLRGVVEGRRLTPSPGDARSFRWSSFVYLFLRDVFAHGDEPGVSEYAVAVDVVSSVRGGDLKDGGDGCVVRVDDIANGIRDALHDEDDSLGDDEAERRGEELLRQSAWHKFFFARLCCCRGGRARRRRPAGFAPRRRARRAWRTPRRTRGRRYRRERRRSSRTRAGCARGRVLRVGPASATPRNVRRVVACELRATRTHRRRPRGGP